MFPLQEGHIRAAHSTMPWQPSRTESLHNANSNQLAMGVPCLQEPVAPHHWVCDLAFRTQMSTNASDVVGRKGIISGGEEREGALD